MNSQTNDDTPTSNDLGGLTLQEDILWKLEEERLRQAFEENNKIQREWEESFRKKVEDEEHQTRLDKEAAASILAEEATNEREWLANIKKEQDEENEFFLEFGCYPYQVFETDSEYETD